VVLVCLWRRLGERCPSYFPLFVETSAYWPHKRREGSLRVVSFCLFLLLHTADSLANHGKGCQLLLRSWKGSDRAKGPMDNLVPLCHNEYGATLPRASRRVGGIDISRRRSVGVLRAIISSSVRSSPSTSSQKDCFSSVHCLN
jgi:hypothetical protein